MLQKQDLHFIFFKICNIYISFGLAESQLSEYAVKLSNYLFGKTIYDIPLMHIGIETIKSYVLFQD